MIKAKHTSDVVCAFFRGKCVCCLLASARIGKQQEDIGNGTEHIGEQHAPQIGIDSVLWHQHIDHKNTDQAGEYRDKQHLSGISKPMQNTVEQACDVQKRAQPGELADKHSGKRVVKQRISDPVSGE